MVKKNCEVWRKMGLFGPDSDPANQLLQIYILKNSPCHDFCAGRSGAAIFGKLCAVFRPIPGPVRNTPRARIPLAGKKTAQPCQPLVFGAAF
jgi:hypothetical protein